MKQKILFGNRVDEIITFLKSKNVSKLFILTGKNSFFLSGANIYFQPVFEQYDHVVFNNFSENPKIEDVYKGIKIFKENECDSCIAIGGGSVIDMAKLICYYNSIDHLNKETVKIKKAIRTVPLLVIPTTAGSGAESTHFAVMYINNKKYSVAHKSILPDFVNLNPELSFKAPRYIKAITGIDALAQGIESFWSKNATKESRNYSEKAIQLVWNNLKLSVLKNDLEAHSKVVLGSNFSGKAINIAKTTAAHALSYYFTTKHNIKHGHAVALMLGKVYYFNYKKVLQAGGEKKVIFEQLNSLLGIKRGMNPEILINNFINDLEIKIDLTKLGINIYEEVNEIINNVNFERLNNNPFNISKKDLIDIILNKQK